MSDMIQNFPAPEIVVKDLCVSYSDKEIFKDFDATFAAGKISVILGSSGVGKTTLLNAVAGLLNYGGSISRGDGNVSYIFQKDRLIPSISVYKNLDLVLRAVIKDKNERKNAIEDMLEELEISHCAKKLPPSLSGGEAQRAAMARAYLYPASVLLLDEPFKALDAPLKSKLISRLLELNRRRPRTVIFVTHAIDECLLAADDWYVLAGNPAQIAGSGHIDAPSRKLSDPSLASVREELLRSLGL